MALGGARGRGKGGVDIESLENDNERGLGALSERSGLLLGAMKQMKDEADAQLQQLDKMEDGMMSTRGVLSSVNDKFKMVMSNKGNRQMTILVLICLSIIVVFWWLSKRK